MISGPLLAFPPSVGGANIRSCHVLKTELLCGEGVVLEHEVQYLAATEKEEAGAAISPGLW